MTQLALRTTAELYPPLSPEGTTKLVAGISNGDRDSDGKLLLRRALTKPERAMLQDRARAVGPWTVPGSRERIVAAVTSMLVGWAAGGKSLTIREAGAIASQYAATLASQPTWAVERACLRFAQGSVTAEEVKAKSVDWSYPPTSAQVWMVTNDLSRHVRQEAVNIGAILRGTVRAEMSAEERERMDAATAAWLEQSGARGRSAAIERESARPLDDRKMADAALREYDRLGISRPAIQPGGLVTTPQLLLGMGWTIEAVNGQNVLVAPPMEPPQPLANEGRY